MYIFQVCKSSCTPYLSRIFSKPSTRMRHYKRTIACAVLVPVAILTGMVALRGQHLSFIPNGVLFSALENAAHHSGSRPQWRRQLSADTEMFGRVPGEKEGEAIKGGM